jgi:predicted ATPase
MSADLWFEGATQPTFKRLHLTNFLSYRNAVLDLGQLTALVGPNSAGKSNAVAAIKLLQGIPFHGLPAAIAMRGGFDQLRHRGKSRPYNPALRLDFALGDAPESYYELQLSAISGKRYEVKSERAEVHTPVGEILTFQNNKGRLIFTETTKSGKVFAVTSEDDRRFLVPPGQSAIATGGAYAAYVVGEVLQGMQPVEINPYLVGELQQPSSTREFEPDGSNTASVFESLTSGARDELIEYLSAIVPGIDRIEMRRLADKLTLAFTQVNGKERREFLAKQMSDGTLRAFAILLALLQPRRPALLVIEEPEIAIHLGALRSLVDILKAQSDQFQVLITTHSADIVDTLDVSELRVVWTEDGASRIGSVAGHTRALVTEGLVTPGELLRSDALDVAQP